MYDDGSTKQLAERLANLRRVLKARGLGDTHDPQVLHQYFVTMARAINAGDAHAAESVEAIFGALQRRPVRLYTEPTTAPGVRPDLSTQLARRVLRLEVQV